MRPEDLAIDASECVAAGADAIHLHPRGPDGHETLDAAVIDAVVVQVATACGVPVGVSTRRRTISTSSSASSGSGSGDS